MLFDITLGENIRVTDTHARTKDRKKKVGKFYKYNKKNIFVDYGSYKESFNMADLICPMQYTLEVKRNKVWRPIERITKNGI